MSSNDTEQANAPILAYAPAELPGDRRRGTGVLAVALSLILPGLGHAYNGLPRRGVMWLGIIAGLYVSRMAALAVPALVPALLILWPVTAIVLIWIWVDAWRTAGGSPGVMPPIGRFLVATVLIFAAVFLHPVHLALMPLHRLYQEHVVETFITTTPPMAPTMVAGDRFICHKYKPWDRWSIVVLDAPAEQGVKYVMRVVALPGETIHIADGQVHVNGKPLIAPVGAGPYISIAEMPRRRGDDPSDEAILLGPHEYYLLGDNSAIAADSRYYGPISAGSIDGPVTWIYWPPSHWRRLGTD